MKITKTFLLTIWLAGLCVTCLRAQQGQYASGGEVSGAGGYYSYTVGQAHYITLSGPGGIMTEGVQQPFEILVISGIEQTGIQLSCAIYPNPATDYVILNTSLSKGELAYQVYNTEGKILVREKVANDQTKILLDKLPDAVYFIKVLNRNQEVKIFKIIKNS